MKCPECFLLLLIVQATNDTYKIYEPVGYAFDAGTYKRMYKQNSRVFFFYDVDNGD